MYLLFHRQTFLKKKKIGVAIAIPFFSDIGIIGRKYNSIYHIISTMCTQYKYTHRKYSIDISAIFISPKILNESGIDDESIMIIYYMLLYRIFRSQILHLTEMWFFFFLRMEWSVWLILLFAFRNGCFGGWKLIDFKK